MAIFHQHFQVIGRSGRSANVVTSGSISGVIGKKSAVAASAYRSGTRLEERIVEYHKKYNLENRERRNASERLRKQAIKKSPEETFNRSIYNQLNYLVRKDK